MAQRLRSAFSLGCDPAVQESHRAPWGEPASPSAYVSTSLSVSHE